MRCIGTAGESPANRVRKTHRGRWSSAAQKKRDQRNEQYYPGSFAFAWLAQNFGTANCNVASTSDGRERSIETERGIVDRIGNSTELQCLLVHRQQVLFLSVYADDLKMAGRKQNLNTKCKTLMKLVYLGNRDHS